MPLLRTPWNFVAGNASGVRTIEIVKRHRAEWMKIPGVLGMMPLEDKINVHAVVFTDAKGNRPAALPQPLAALPKEIEGVPVALILEYALPPPPGVTIVKPGGVYVQADACPPGYIETTDKGWRFCLDFKRPEAIPPLMALPIAGIPYAEAFEILNRHREELQALPGVGAVGMGAKGIYLEAKDPAVIPKEVEGLPIDVHPFTDELRETKNHTESGTWNSPARGGLYVRVVNSNGDFEAGTTTGVAYDGGGMWLIFPTHLLPAPECSGPSNCTTSSLAECRDRYPRYPLFFLLGGGRRGQVIKWTPINVGSRYSTLDVAAAWIDDAAQNQGDSSSCADRRIEGGTEHSFDWTGMEGTAAQGNVLYMYSKNNPHYKPVTVKKVDVSESLIYATSCLPGYSLTYLHQLEVTAPIGTLDSGSSGAPIMTVDGKIVAMFQWANYLENRGGGILASYIRTTLGFRNWYGTSTFPNNAQVCQ